MNIELWQGDCLELMKDIPDRSVDMILTDPPYGTIKNKPTTWKEGTTDWDITLPTKLMFDEFSRVLRPNGRCILFCQEPYTTELITNTIPSVPFSYRAIWVKNVAGNHLKANKAMLNMYEDILIFNKIVREETTDHPLRSLFLNELNKSGKSKKDAINLIGSSASHYFTSGLQFRMPTKEKFELLCKNNFISLDFNECSAINENYLIRRYSKIAKQTPSVFNLWEGGKSKSNILKYAKDKDKFHPTQKPVALLEDLIKTYTNEGDVVDNCMGSGSTGVACVNTNRNFIGIELDKHYFEIAQARIRGELQ